MGELLGPGIPAHKGERGGLGCLIDTTDAGFVKQEILSGEGLCSPPFTDLAATSLDVGSRCISSLMHYEGNIRYWVYF